MRAASWRLLAVLGAILGSAGFATVALAHAGVSFCARRIALAPPPPHLHHHHHHGEELGLFFGYGPAADALSLCPIVLVAAVVCASSLAVAAVALAAGREHSGETWRASLEVLARFSIARLTGALALACALPTALGAHGELGGLAEAAIAAVWALALSALVVFAARLATALARRILIALRALIRPRPPRVTLPASRGDEFSASARQALLARGHATRAPPIAA